MNSYTSTADNSTTSTILSLQTLSVSSRWCKKFVTGPKLKTCHYKNNSILIQIYVLVVNLTKFQNNGIKIVIYLSVPCSTICRSIFLHQSLPCYSEIEQSTAINWHWHACNFIQLLTVCHILYCEMWVICKLSKVFEIQKGKSCPVITPSLRSSCTSTVLLRRIFSRHGQ